MKHGNKSAHDLLVMLQQLGGEVSKIVQLIGKMIVSDKNFLDSKRRVL